MVLGFGDMLFAQLTGLAKTTADRRAQTLMRWREYVRAPESAITGPELPNLTSQLASLIATHNALAKQRYLEWLLKMAKKRNGFI